MASNSTNHNQDQLEEDVTQENFDSTAYSIINEVYPFLDASNTNEDISHFTSLIRDEVQLDENIADEIISFLLPNKPYFEDTMVNSLEHNTVSSLQDNDFQNNINIPQDNIQTVNLIDSILVDDKVCEQTEINNLTNDECNFETYSKNKTISSNFSDNIQTMPKVEPIKNISKDANISKENNGYCDEKKATHKVERMPLDSSFTVIKKSFILPTLASKKKSKPSITQTMKNVHKSKLTINTSKSSTVNSSITTVNPLQTSMDNSNTTIASSSRISTPSPVKMSTTSPSGISIGNTLKMSTGRPSRKLTASSSKVSTGSNLLMLTNSPSKMLTGSPSRMQTASPSKMTIATPSSTAIANPSGISIHSPSRMLIANPSKSVASPLKRSIANHSEKSEGSNFMMSASSPSNMSTSRPSSMAVTSFSKMSTDSTSKLLICSPSRMQTSSPSKMSIVSNLGTSIPNPSEMSIDNPLETLIGSLSKSVTNNLKRSIANYSDKSEGSNLIMSASSPSNMPTDNPSSMSITSFSKISTDCSLKKLIGSPSRMQTASSSKTSTVNSSEISIDSPSRTSIANPSKSVSSHLKRSIVSHSEKSTLNNVLVSTSSLLNMSSSSPSSMSKTSFSKVSTDSPSDMSIGSPSNISISNSSHMTNGSPNMSTSFSKMSMGSSTSMSITSSKLSTSNSSNLLITTSKISTNSPSNITKTYSSKMSTASPSRMSTDSPSKIPTSSLRISIIRPSNKSKDSPSTGLNFSKISTIVSPTSYISPSKKIFISPSKTPAFTPSRSLTATPSELSTVSQKESAASSSRASIISPSRSSVFTSSESSSTIPSITPSQISTVSISQASILSSLTKSNVQNLNSNELLHNASPCKTNNPYSQLVEKSSELQLTVMPITTNIPIDETNKSQLNSDFVTGIPRNNINDAVTNIVLQIKKSPTRKINMPVKLIKINDSKVTASNDLTKLYKLSQNQLSIKEDSTQKQIKVQPKKYIPTILLRTNRNQCKDYVSKELTTNWAETAEKSNKINQLITDKIGYPNVLPNLSSTYLTPKSEIINRISPMNISSNTLIIGNQPMTSNAISYVSGDVNSSTMSTWPSYSAIKEANNKNQHFVNNSEYSSEPLLFTNKTKELIPVMTISDFSPTNNSVTTVASDTSAISENSDNISISSSKTDILITTSDSSYSHNHFSLVVAPQSTKNISNSEDMMVAQNTRKVKNEIPKHIHKISDNETNFKQFNVNIEHDSFQNNIPQNMTKLTKDVYMNVIKSNPLSSAEMNPPTVDLVNGDRISKYNERGGRGRRRGRRPKVNSTDPKNYFTKSLYTDINFVQMQNNKISKRGKGRGRGTRRGGRRANHLIERSDNCKTNGNENIKAEYVCTHLENNEVPRKKRKYTRRKKDHTTDSNIELLEAIRQIEIENCNSTEKSEETGTSKDVLQENALKGSCNQNNTNIYQHFLHQNQESISHITSSEYSQHYNDVRSVQNNTQEFDKKCEMGSENRINYTSEQDSHNETNIMALHCSQNTENFPSLNDYNSQIVSSGVLEANLESNSYNFDYQINTENVDPETNCYIPSDAQAQSCLEMLDIYNDQQGNKYLTKPVLQSDAQNNLNIWSQNHPSTSDDYNQHIIMNLDDQPNLNMDSVLTSEERKHLLKFTSSKGDKYKHDFSYFNMQENMEAIDFNQIGYDENPCNDFYVTSPENVYQYSNFPEKIDGASIPSSIYQRGYYKQRRARGKSSLGARNKPDKPYICPVCGTCEQYNALLERHLQIEHGYNIGYYYS
ncbi:hypothetical protein L9F63_008480 [Diploptera punctata]|uniref:Uncharacterized protein n=1 Tax=Diploptera punctata TaxID=6984 RepID=A0AAD7Z5H3_DIPPU|nr:hypothetical protein L9F63_008480 [Diploptera punctata]